MDGHRYEFKTCIGNKPAQTFIRPLLLAHLSSGRQPNGVGDL